MKKFFRITTWLLGFSTLVAGLAASSMGAYSVRAQTAAPEALTREVTLKDLPLDATMALSAPALTMQGRDETTDMSPVMLSPAAKTALRTTGLRNKGFKLTGFTLTAYENSTAFSDAVMASAILNFIDTAGQ